MRVLLDHNLPKRLCAMLIGHEARTARQMTWDKLGNGVLLRAASEAGFDVFLSMDKKLEHEQNLSALPTPRHHDRCRVERASRAAAVRAVFAQSAADSRQARTLHPRTRWHRSQITRASQIAQTLSARCR